VTLADRAGAKNGNVWMRRYHAQLGCSPTPCS
jgi:hypothetical protein